jgi:hypothetical protein
MMLGREVPCTELGSPAARPQAHCLPALLIEAECGAVVEADTTWMTPPLDWHPPQV